MAAREGNPAPPLYTSDDLTAVSAATRLESPRREAAAMSHSMYSAGRSTHLKVVIVSLLCATVVAVLGILARASDMNGARAASRTETMPPVIRAGWPKTVTSNEHNTIR
jgi:hypothetical protein